MKTRDKDKGEDEVGAEWIEDVRLYARSASPHCGWVQKPSARIVLVAMSRQVDVVSVSAEVLSLSCGSCPSPFSQHMSFQKESGFGRES